MSQCQKQIKKVTSQQLKMLMIKLKFQKKKQRQRKMIPI